MVQAKLLVEDFRAQALGGIVVGLDMWEAAILPTLLYNCSTWVELDKEAEEKLEDLKLHYLRLFLAVPVSCPKVALILHTGVLSMKHRIWIEKVMLVFYIRKLAASTLANMVYKEQLGNKWPGLAAEVTDICKSLEVESVHETKLPKGKYKSLLTKACFNLDENELKIRLNQKIKTW